MQKRGMNGVLAASYIRHSKLTLVVFLFCSQFIPQKDVIKLIKKESNLKRFDARDLNEFVNP